MQDAGLYTHQRTLDIRFVDDELALHKQGRIRGSAFAITNKQYTQMSTIGSQVPVPKIIGMKRVMSVDDTTEMQSAVGGSKSREGSKHGGGAVPFTPQLSTTIIPPPPAS